MINKITKEKIALALKGNIGLSATLCSQIVENVFKQIMQLTIEEKKLVLPNFGKLSLHHKSSRPARNLQSNQNIILPARTVINFTPSKNLKILINTDAVK